MALKVKNTRNEVDDELKDKMKSLGFEIIFDKEEDKDPEEKEDED